MYSTVPRPLRTLRWVSEAAVVSGVVGIHQLAAHGGEEVEVAHQVGAGRLGGRRQQPRPRLAPRPACRPPDGERRSAWPEWQGAVRGHAGGGTARAGTGNGRRALTGSRRRVRCRAAQDRRGLRRAGASDGSAAGRPTRSGHSPSVGAEAPGLTSGASPRPGPRKTGIDLDLARQEGARGERGQRAGVDLADEQVGIAEEAPPSLGLAVDHGYCVADQLGLRGAILLRPRSHHSPQWHLSPQSLSTATRVIGRVYSSDIGADTVRLIPPAILGECASSSPQNSLPRRALAGCGQVAAFGIPRTGIVVAQMFRPDRPHTKLSSRLDTVQAKAC